NEIQHTVRRDEHVLRAAERALEWSNERSVQCLRRRSNIGSRRTRQCSTKALHELVDGRSVTKVHAGNDTSLAQDVSGIVRSPKGLGPRLSYIEWTVRRELDEHSARGHCVLNVAQRRDARRRAELRAASADRLLQLLHLISQLRHALLLRCRHAVQHHRGKLTLHSREAGEDFLIRSVHPASKRRKVISHRIERPPLPL